MAHYSVYGRTQSLRALLLVGVLGAGCAPAAEGPTLSIVVLAEEGRPRPTHLIVTWLKGDRPVIEGQRVPATGSLPASGQLALILVARDPVDPSDRKLAIRGFSPPWPPSVAVARIRPDTGDFAVTMRRHLPDADGDGVPDEIDDCPAVPRGRPPCGMAGHGAAPEAGAAPDEPPPAMDAGAPPDAPPPGQRVDARAAPPPDATPRPQPEAGRPPEPTRDGGGPPGGASPPPGALGIWRFDEGAGLVVSDDSPHGNHGTLRSPTGRDWVAGHGGTALSFERRNWVRTADSPSYDRTSAALSIAAWVLWGGPTEEAQAILARQRGTSSDNLFWLGASGGLARFTVADIALETAATPLPVGQWVHVTAVWDGAVMRLYFSGAEVARRAVAPPAAGGSTGVTIGADVNGSDPNVPVRLFRGRLDEVHLYGRALTAAEVAALAR